MKRPPLQVPYAVVVGSMVGNLLALSKLVIPVGQPQASTEAAQNGHKVPRGLFLQAAI
jgi:hypothetical protein